MELKYNTEIVGCIHIHSTYSDGTESVPYIAGLAGELNLDYLMISDHMTLQAIIDGHERWFEKTLVLIGYEINDIDDTNHYLAFGLNEEVNRHLPAKKYVKEVNIQGGLGIIAHPDEKRNLMDEHPPYPWTAWDSQYYSGIEIWNGLSEWMEGLTHINKIYRFFHPRKSLIAPMKETLKRWDNVNLNRKVVGIGGVDAHAHIYKAFGIIPVRIFHYKVQFKTIRTHILLDSEWVPGENKEKYKNNIYRSLFETRCFISNFKLGDARGFRFWANRNGSIVEMGETTPYEDDFELNCRTPVNCRIDVIHNGSTIYSHKGNTMTYVLSFPGVYRLEVYKENKAWIFSNHIRFI